MISSQIAAARNLQGRGQVGLHQPKRFLVFRYVVSDGAGNRVLQQPLIGDQALTIDGLHLRGIEIHRHHADAHQHAENYVQNRNPSWQEFAGQSAFAPSPMRRTARTVL